MLRDVRRSEVVEIRTLIQRVIETGICHDCHGDIVPRDSLNCFTCTLGEEKAFAVLLPSTATFLNGRGTT
ncbi:MAG: thiosulfate oxidation carrier complex protein SoxZ [Alphaproteobacteria bacterium]|nr:thiosulfate oxidation carrier complex protein SoxZ [Alphaproteobacteria bacterium]